MYLKELGNAFSVKGEKFMLGSCFVVFLYEMRHELLLMLLVKMCL